MILEERVYHEQLEGGGGGAPSEAYLSSMYYSYNIWHRGEPLWYYTVWDTLKTVLNSEAKDEYE